MSERVVRLNRLRPSRPSTLQDRTAVVFGGTSGIGLAAAKQAKAASAEDIAVDGGARLV